MEDSDLEDLLGDIIDREEDEFLRRSWEEAAFRADNENAEEAASQKLLEETKQNNVLVPNVTTT